MTDQNKHVVDIENINKTTTILDTKCFILKIKKKS